MRVKIRKAFIADDNFFFTLRNETTVRKSFFQQKKIKFFDHLKWYKKKLKEKKIIFLVAFINKTEKIGIVRYETKKMFTNISIAISKEFRKFGYGSDILRKSEKFLKKKTIIISKIKKNNKASIKIFKKNNYKIIKKKNNSLALIKFI
jgi:spore coat polysaccharide biosynthesis protein SpsF